jgi:hypothetical protein
MAKIQRENTRLKQENEISKRLWVSSKAARREIPVHSAALGAVSCGGAVPSDADHP